MFQFAKPEWEVKAKARLNILEARAAAVGSAYDNIQNTVIAPLNERRKNLVHNLQSVLNKDGIAEEIAAIDEQLAEAQTEISRSHVHASKLRSLATKARRAFEEATNTNTFRVSTGG